jgi:hypothetical protein
MLINSGDFHSGKCECSAFLGQGNGYTGTLFSSARVV